MNMNKTFSAALLLAIMVLSQGCATILSGSKQRVRVTSTPSGADVLLNGKKVGTTPAKIRVPRRDGGVVEVQKEGQRPQTELLSGTKFNPMMLVNIPFSLLIMPWVIDMLTGANKRLDKNKLDFVLKPSLQKIEGANMTYCSELVFNVKAGDKVGERIIQSGAKENIYFEESFKGDAAAARSTLNDRLRDLGFKTPEAKGQLFAPTSQAHYLIKGEVLSMQYKVQMVPDYTTSSYKTTTICDISIKWQLVTRGNELKHELTTKGNAVALEQSSIAAFNQALERSFEEFIAEEKVYATVKESYSAEDIAKKFELLQINQPAAFADNDKIINSATNAIVTIDIGDSHGSGCIISEDGYIVTNYHVVEGVEKVNVRFKSGIALEGSVVRSNKDFDLALVKVNGAGFTPIRMNTEKDINVGIDVYAIGTPADKTLGQTVTKGIISGVRKDEDREFIQTDVSINPGNSGGGLIDKKGTLIGIVNAKLVGTGIEGIGFAIPTHIVFEKLKIAYK